MSFSSLLVVLGAYALGSVPFGVVFARIFQLGDLRQQGSGNIGATNVLRTGNALAAFLTLLCDALKGFLPVYLLSRWNPAASEECLVAFACVLGHVFPIWCRFKGGKGVATAAGVYLALDPIVFLVGVSVWGLTFALTKISSLSALVSLCGVLPCFVGVQVLRHLLSAEMLTLSVLLAALLGWTHRSNIRRLLTHSEKSIKKSS